MKPKMIVGGISYDVDTPQGAIDALQYAMRSSLRYRLFYGDQKDGQVWLEEHDVVGYVHHSTGPAKVPLLVYDGRCIGGYAISTDSVLRVVCTKDKRELYRHPKYNVGIFRIRKREDLFPDCPELITRVDHRYSDQTEWDNVANFTSTQKAINYTNFMVGKRMRQ